MQIEWRGVFANDEVNRLHAEAFEHDVVDDDWIGLTARHSLGWVTARDAGDLAGFVNVLWDGLAHAWIQDLMVAGSFRRHGVGASLVAAATDGARSAGCEWLHVDFDDDLAVFYLDRCGFRSTGAGLIALR